MAGEIPGNQSVRVSNVDRQFAPRLSAWLRTRNFGSVLTRFNQLRTSPSAHGRFRFVIYAVPITFATMGAISNFMNQSLTIYLRYQAMVDEYYHSRMILSNDPL